MKKKSRLQNHRKDLLARAIAFAAWAHRHGLRKDDKTPYIAHPVQVMMTLAELGVKDEEALAAAVLHDTIEDTSADYDDLAEKFGPRVAGFVADLTKDKRLREDIREKAYFDRLTAAKIEVKLIKIADVMNNLRDSADIKPRSPKSLAKAKDVLKLFKGSIPPQWSRVERRLKEAVQR